MFIRTITCKIRLQTDISEQWIGYVVIAGRNGMALITTERGVTMSHLEVGDKAPDFCLPDDQGNMISLAQLAGKPVVVYFYPKDDTSGCTKEAIAFSALKPDFDKLGVRVIGISPDSPEKHGKFRSKHGLTVDLAADVERKVLEAYGVWVEKSLYGRKYMGVERTTVLIDASGHIARIWNKVKVAGHAEAVLEAARAL